MRAQLGDAYSRAGGDDEQAARIARNPQLPRHTPGYSLANQRSAGCPDKIDGSPVNFTVQAVSRFLAIHLAKKFPATHEPLLQYNVG
jgi:hypothetical protein